MFTFTVRQLEVFLAVCEAGSFRRAADMLGMSEAGVSNHVRMLEEQLGRNFFERRRGAAVGLTDTGVAFKRDATTFVRMGIDLGRRDTPGQSVAVTFHLFIGDHILEDYVRPKLSNFLCNNPDINFAFLRISSLDEVTRAIRNGELDGALAAVAGEADLPQSELIAEAGLSIYARPELQRLAEAQGLGALPYLVGGFSIASLGPHDKVFRRFGVENAKVVGHYPFHDVGVKMAIQGVGAIMMLDTMVEKFDPKQELVRIRGAAVWQRRLYLSPKIDPDRASRIRSFLLESLD